MTKKVCDICGEPALKVDDTIDDVRMFVTMDIYFAIKDRRQALDICSKCRSNLLVELWKKFGVPP